VKDAKLKIEQGGKSSELPLTATSRPPQCSARRLSIRGSGTFRLAPQSRSSVNFTNKFSPQYEIRSRGGPVPRVVLEEPSGDLLVPPDEVVAVKGLAKDDIGLRKVTQAVKVNQGDWKETVLAQDPALEVKIGRMWDVYDLRVQPGDHVAMKLIAVDLKGNRAESAPVHLTISARGFDPQRLVPLAAKEAMYAELAAPRRGAARSTSTSPRRRPAGAEELQRKQDRLRPWRRRQGLAGRGHRREPREGRAARLAHGPRRRRPHPRGAAGEAPQGGHLQAAKASWRRRPAGGARARRDGRRPRERVEETTATCWPPRRPSRRSTT
jgi:hypothetical protein